MSRPLIKAIIVVSTALLALALFQIYSIWQLSHHTDQIQRELATIRSAAQNSTTEHPATTGTTETPAPSDQPSQPAPDTAALLAINPDYIGWLKIDGTTIDFPVVQTTDDYKYLHTDFYGDPWKRGTIFASAFSSNPIVLFGHQQDMFEDLEHYKDPTFLAAHPTIQFAERSYQIVAVYHFQNGMGPDNAPATSYTDYYGTSDPIAFLETLASSPNTIYLAPDLSPAPAANFLALQTCTYEVSGTPLYDSRLVVLAIER